MAGVLAILFVSGLLKTKQEESYGFLQRELESTGEKLKQDYSAAALYTIELARLLSPSLEMHLRANALTTADLDKHPELLEELLAGQLNSLTTTLEKSRCSGALLILDATVNPTAPGAHNYRAGLYLKDIDPGAIGAPNLKFLLGPVDIARKNKLPVLPQWRMEFNVTDLPGFKKLMTTGETSLPLSRLYYWAEASPLVPATEPAMLCLAPLKDSKGRVFGVCGLEISSMLFKLSYSPPQTTLNDVFFLFAPASGDAIQIDGALTAGCYCPLPKSRQPLAIQQREPFNRYVLDDEAYAGLHQELSLYPEDSAFEQRWRLALLIPEQELTLAVTAQNKRLYLLLFGLTLAAVAVTLIGGRYVKPTPEAQGAVPPAPQTQASSILISQFNDSVGALSIAEKAVFDLYLKGFTAQEAAKTLYLSINTIKTHNKRIFTKFNVSSRKELMLYIQMVKELS